MHVFVLFVLRSCNAIYIELYNFVTHFYSWLSNIWPMKIVSCIWPIRFNSDNVVVVSATMQFAICSLQFAICCLLFAVCSLCVLISLVIIHCRFIHSVRPPCPPCPRATVPPCHQSRPFPEPKTIGVMGVRANVTMWFTPCRNLLHSRLHEGIVCGFWGPHK